MSGAETERRPKIRLFVAVDPGEPMHERIGRALGRVHRRAPDAKWVRPESMHVTLAFLGYEDEDRVPLITEALKRVAVRHAPLVLRARGAGAFGSPKRPRVLWTDLSGEVDALCALKADVDEALGVVGFVPDARPFRPHLTLARAREQAGDAGFVACVDDLGDTDFGEAHVDALILFQSQLSPSGARYTALARLALGGAR